MRLLDTVLFDLDDTLYPEMDFVLSGFRYVSQRLSESQDEQDILLARMRALFQESKAGVFDRLALELVSSRRFPSGGSISEAELQITRHDAQTLSRNMVMWYRSHNPMISLYPDASEILTALRLSGVRVGLVTDGCWEVQERKVRALGLESVMDLVVFTDRIAPNRECWKPSTRPFEIALQYFEVGPSKACYVGDNPNKDFAGPRQMGMHSVWVRRVGGFHCDFSEGDCDVEYVVTSLGELLSLSLFKST